MLCFVSSFTGLTETSAGGTSTDIKNKSHGHVGTPVNCVEIKLVDVPDMNYYTTDKPEPRGEIWIRGPCVFKGYYKNREKTDEVLTEDGWFATGDVGKWQNNGKLVIIDRKKNIFKLAQGEYIRPEYIENIYKQSPYIANAFVYGNSLQTFLVAIIVPDWEVIPEWAQKNGLKDIADVCLIYIYVYIICVCVCVCLLLQWWIVFVLYLFCICYVLFVVFLLFLFLYLFLFVLEF